MVLPRDFVDAALRVLIAVALAIDAVVHLKLAYYYQIAAPGGIGQGNLFWIEAGAAILAGLYVFFRGSRPAYAAALIVTFGGVAAVLLYRYVDVPAFGPFPAMYEPVWFFEKSLSAVAEAAGAVLAAVGLFRKRPAHLHTGAQTLAR
ncbi:hypothetical protein JOF48_003465 [Arthrobacter stackebrandtii]|uniref:Integral membrane protein n=1 Tax=Arthrobacter stackebrandtii TaxID=272161 RepID=A0ABS4Z0Z1_9MICC|nr:hypothetical protein [Arthrobacter stackebrandtii]MBP2414666.1 hypothetical protein [Arthrobacter stackebrandtii]PYH01759.1 hypothetical protein CVV67_04720 [Arthrobacter stackebrandtii]